AVGGVYAHWIGYIDASTSFDLVFSIEVFLVALIGGRWFVVGPLIGALVFRYVEDVAVRNTVEAQFGVLGAVLIVLVL
ncbi:MAG TPA: hypothetical protein PLV68_09215, partial [Ilumatobacteraceae bacterium]|nr:hypothetical protein [Ilumatobacteraceae bacterium]